MPTTTTTVTSALASGITKTVTTTEASPADAPTSDVSKPAPITDLTTVCDEALSGVLGALPPTLCDFSDIHAARAVFDGLFAAMPSLEMPSDVEVTEVMVPGHLASDPEVRVKVYRPNGLPAGSPCMYAMTHAGPPTMSQPGSHPLSGFKARGRRAPHRSSDLSKASGCRQF